MFSSSNKNSNPPSQDHTPTQKNIAIQPGASSFPKNFISPEKVRNDIPSNNNPEHLPAYMNSMKIVPSPSFNFAGTDTTLNVNTQPKNAPYNQNARIVESSDKTRVPEQKANNNKSLNNEVKSEAERPKLNKKNSLTVSNETEKSKQESLGQKKQENSTEATRNLTPDSLETVSDAKSSKTRQNNESSSAYTVTKSTTVTVREPLLDNERSDIPLNIQMLKQKFRDEEAKIAKAEEKEDGKGLKQVSQSQVVERSRGKTVQDEVKKEKNRNEGGKMDAYMQNAGKQVDGQSNWLYKKFTEAELVKKEETNKKSWPGQNEVSEDGKGQAKVDQSVRSNNSNNTRNTQEFGGHLIEKVRTVPSRPGNEVEKVKKSAMMPQEMSNQYQIEKNRHLQYVQAQGNPNKEQKGYAQDTSLNVSQSDLAPSRDPMSTSQLLEHSQILKMANWPQNGHIDFSAMSIQSMNPQEQQKKTLQIIAFYEQHLNNFKGLIIQQTNVIDAQKLKISSLENQLKESNDKVKVFEQELLNQAMSNQKSHQELLAKYSETSSQLNITQADLEKALKKLGEYSIKNNNKDIGNSNNDNDKAPNSETVSPPKKQEKGKDNMNSLYKEIFSIKKDLDTQRDIMKETKYSTPNKQDRESKAEEMRKSVNSDAELIKDECDTVYPLTNAHERLSTEPGRRTQRKTESSSVPRVGNQRDRSSDNQYERDESRGRLNRSPFPIEEQMEENARSLIQSKQRSQGTRVRDLLNWHTPSKKKDNEFMSPNKSSIGIRMDTGNSMDTDGHNLTCERIDNRSSSTDIHPLSRSPIIGFSSNQKLPKNSEEIEKLQNLIKDLYHEKKSVEDELLKIPENWKTLEHRRRKAKIEAEIERIDERMEEYKRKLRDLNGSPMKQRR